MEDAIALDKAMAANRAMLRPRFLLRDGAAAGPRQAHRRRQRQRPEWYEHFAEHMELSPAEFAMSYIRRSGRVDLDRLRKLSPRFVERYEKERK